MSASAPAPGPTLPPAASITADHTHPRFTDPLGRHLLLRGLNVSGDAKYPSSPSPLPAVNTPAYYDTSAVSYLNRPFPLAHASAWWARLRSWGVNVVRLVVCWEALEPRRMGEFDEEYIGYLVSIVKSADEQGVQVFIDGHQDCWSRFSGGSGAPLWTFELAGLDARKFSQTSAAALDAPAETSALSAPSGRLWPTNYSKFAVATMFTLFFAGEEFAPTAVYEGGMGYEELKGRNVGEVLQTAYIRAYARLMERLRAGGARNVLGVDPMNEPHAGYIGLPSLLEFNENTELHLGLMPNALESMLLAGGEAVEVGLYTRSWPQPSRRTKTVVVNAEKQSVWLPGRRDIWKDAGVYTSKSSYRETFFHRPSRDFERDYYVPFLRRFQAATRPHLLFVEPIPNLPPPHWDSKDRNIVYSPHWYDIRVLYEKALNPTVTFDVLSLAAGSRNFLKHTYFFARGLTQNYTANLTRIVAARKKFRPQTETPVLIGETGIPWDINRLAAYRTPPDVRAQRTMLRSLLTALDTVRANYTLWNFALNHTHTAPAAAWAGNDNDTGARVQAGDGWNSEDFSIVCPKTGGVRVGAAEFIRPYPVITAGVLEALAWDEDAGRLEVAFAPGESEREEGRTSRWFVPERVFARGGLVRIVHGEGGDVEGPLKAGRGKGWRWEWRREGQELVLVAESGVARRGRVWVVVEKTI